MDFRLYLSRSLSKRYVDHLVTDVFQNPDEFGKLYQLIFDTDDKVPWRAAWACQKISEKHPEWFSLKNFNELSELAISTKHGGVKRGCLSILNNLPMPRTISVELINACFDWMISDKSPIAVQALSMKLLLKIIKIEPDLKGELIAYLEAIDIDNYSAGFKSTRRNVLKNLNYN